jgi:hypothetical protein
MATWEEIAMACCNIKETGERYWCDEGVCVEGNGERGKVDKKNGKGKR